MSQIDELVGCWLLSIQHHRCSLYSVHYSVVVSPDGMETRVDRRCDAILYDGLYSTCKVYEMRYDALRCDDDDNKAKEHNQNSLN